MWQLFCTTLLAYGIDISFKATDRRDLNNPAAKHVVTLLAGLIDALEDLGEAETIEADFGNLLTGKQARMCRKCYLMYERFISTRSTICRNLNTALDSLMPSSSKRLKLDDQSSTNLSIPASSNSGQSTVSPIVAVSTDMNVHVSLIYNTLILGTCMIFNTHYYCTVNHWIQAKA